MTFEEGFIWCLLIITLGLSVVALIYLYKKDKNGKNDKSKKEFLNEFYVVYEVRYSHSTMKYGYCFRIEGLNMTHKEIDKLKDKIMEKHAPGQPEYIVILSWTRIESSK